MKNLTDAEIDRRWDEMMARVPVPPVYPKKTLAITRETFGARVTIECQPQVWIAAVVPYCLTHLRGKGLDDFIAAIEADGFQWEWAP